MATIDRLTEIRQAMWNAIDNYSHLSTSFEQKYKFDGETSLIDPDSFTPELGACPAIGIWPNGGGFPWFTNTEQKASCQFDIIIWTPGWELASTSNKPERLLMQVLSALWMSGPSSEDDENQSYLKQASCFFPKNVGFKIDRAKTGSNASNELTRTTLSVTLEFKFNPRTIVS